MAFTYSTLRSALRDYMQSDEAVFVATIPTIVRQAEDRILTEAQLPNFRKNVTGSMTSGDQYLGIPTDYLAPYSMAIDNSGHEFLIFKDVNFVREAYPVTSTTGVPKYYATFDDSHFLIGPTPNSTFAVELHYFYRPESIADAASGTSWLGTNAESALLYGCIVEAYMFLKGDPDLMQAYKDRYDPAMARLKLLAEGYNRTDSYRAG